AWKPPTGIHPSINLPLAFKIYYNKMFTFSNFYIAHEEGRKLHAVSGHSKRLIGPGETKLHSGPEPTSPVLGSALIDYKKIEVRLTGGT
ncbi:uncharacterized protein K489DRAFT_293439, partial [Dissoconium aciculare CBS 342.82]|uniref:Uncharacterized protein n=1 Tax=Dissoconium aciculare CBS 342.82 TaxID=1314786 RepID=A0A6J3LSS9_9PEZI